MFRLARTRRTCLAGFQVACCRREGGGSSAAFANKIIDGFFEVAIAASVGRCYTVVHPVKSLSFSFHTCHSGVPDTVSRSSLLTSTGFSPTRLRFSVLFAQAVFVSRSPYQCSSSGLVHCFCFCLFAPNHDAHELDRHNRRSGLDCFCTLRRGVSSPLKKSKTQRQNRTAFATPTRLGAGNPGLRLLGFQIRKVMEELIYDAEFHASLGTLYASRARLHAIFNVAETLRPTFLTGSILALSTSASTLTFAARAPKGSLLSHKRSSCHGSRTWPSRSFNSLWRPTSRMCQVLTWSASTSLMPSKPSQFREHEEGYVAFQIDRVWYTYRVIPFGLASNPFLCEAHFQQFSYVRVSRCSSPRSSESKQWTTPRGSLKDHLSDGVSFRSCSCSPGGKANMASVCVGWAPRSPSARTSVSVQCG